MKIGANASVGMWNGVTKKTDISVYIMAQMLKNNIVVSGVVKSKRVNMRAKVEKHLLEWSWILSPPWQFPSLFKAIVSASHFHKPFAH